MTTTRASSGRTLGVAEVRRALEGLTVAVPGSSGNLGAGFDALALAVQLYVRVTVRRVLDGPRGTVTSTFADVELDGEDYVARTMTDLARSQSLDFPSLELSISSDIPMQSGLGSSAAATVAGLLLYDRLAGSGPDLLTLGATIEGHPDNVAASLLGGLTAACVRDNGEVVAISTPWPEAVRLVAITPTARVKTPEARRVLPSTIGRGDAVFNLQRVALLLQALRTGRLDAIRDALQDRWHQPYRVALVPGLSEALELEHEDLLGVCLSGSGPTVLALCGGETAGVERALGSLYERLGIPCRIRALAAHNGRPGVAGPNAS